MRKNIVLLAVVIALLLAGIGPAAAEGPSTFKGVPNHGAPDGVNFMGVGSIGPYKTCVFAKLDVRLEDLFQQEWGNLCLIMGLPTDDYPNWTFYDYLWWQEFTLRPGGYLAWAAYWDMTPGQRFAKRATDYYCLVPGSCTHACHDPASVECLAAENVLAEQFDAALAQLVAEAAND